MLNKAIFPLTFIFTLSFIFYSTMGKETIAQTTQPKPAAQTPLVVTAHSKARSYTQTITLYGVTEAKERTLLKAQTVGRVEEILPVEGRYVEKDAVLVRLAAEERPAKLSMAQALVEQRRLEYKVATALAKKGHQSETEVAASYAALQQAQLELVMAELEMKYTTLTAPFAGYVEKIHVHLGDTVKARDTEVATLLNDQEGMVVVYAPEKYHGLFERESEASITLSDGTQKSGKLQTISRLANSNTRSFRIEIAYDMTPFVDGLTAKVSIPVATQEAHLVKDSVLGLNVAGEVGIKAVDESQKVIFYPVEVIGQEKEGIWVKGLPKEAHIITLGHAFYLEGEKVRIESKDTEHE